MPLCCSDIEQIKAVNTLRCGPKEPLGLVNAPRRRQQFNLAYDDITALVAVVPFLFAKRMSDRGNLICRRSEAHIMDIATAR